MKNYKNTINSVRMKLPKPLKKILRYFLNLLKATSNSVKRKFRKYHRLFYPVVTDSYTFAILCVKKTAYADMAIENINSLHYLNPNHKAIIYCDTLCAKYLQAKNKKFNYSDKVTIKNAYGIADKPWQHYKIEVHIEAGRVGHIDTDADGIWHDDPVIDRKKITMLTLSNKIKDRPNDQLVIEKVFNRKEWGEFNHYVAAFVSIPPLFMTDKLARDMRDYNNIIFNHQLYFITTEEEKNGIRRLSEEFAVNLALQSNFPTETIAVLKTEDGQGSQQSLQSLYYGCRNQVNE